MSEATTAQATSGGFGAYRDKLGMWFFLCSDAMMFAALLIGYAMIRIANLEAWPDPSVILNIPMTALFTFDLIVSSVTMVKAFEASDRDDEWWMKFWLGCTIFFGAAFIGFQIYEWGHFFSEGIIPGYWSTHGLEHFAHQASVAVSNLGVMKLFFGTFYALTGFHGFHVTCGVIYNSVVLFNIWRGKYDSTEERSHSLEIAGLYWHFVDLVWILLFTFIYLV